MDYTPFLQKPGETLRLPYFEGRAVCDDRRTYRLRQSLAPGWYQFRASGRFLISDHPIEPELGAWKLPRVVGYVMGARLVTNEYQAPLFGLPEHEDLPKFSPVSARKWFDGHLLYETAEFETEAENRVRTAFEEDQAIDRIKAVSPALAHTFLLESTQRELKREAERRARALAERERQAAQLASQQQTVEGQIALALSHTGAELISWRRQGHDQAAVRYGIGGHRFECVINTRSLQILDAGICLEGADEELNLSSLPSAVREAIESGQLHVFRPG